MWGDLGYKLSDALPMAGATLRFCLLLWRVVIAAGTGPDLLTPGPLPGYTRVGMD